jgi:hypothetical protein
MSFHVLATMKAIRNILSSDHEVPTVCPSDLSTAEVSLIVLPRVSYVLLSPIVTCYLAFASLLVSGLLSEVPAIPLFCAIVSNICDMLLRKLSLLSTT